MKFDRLYNLIMEDTFDDLPYQEQRERVQSSFEQGANTLWQSLEQFDLFVLILNFDDEMFAKYKEDDWSYQNSKKYAKELKDKNIVNDNYAYFDNVKGEQTWQDVANEVWEYYGV